MKIVCTNRKAYHNYHIEETIEAGISLYGTEVKSLRDGKANLADSYAAIKDGQAYLLNAHISPYSHGNIQNHDPVRIRKLLLHKREMMKLQGKLTNKGYTLVALKVYFIEKGIAKVELGLAKGKRQYEKKEAIKEREARREVEKALKI
jgi:SsrA-binding protein